MKLAYVAGPYRDPRGQWFVHQNIETARRIAAELWARGYAVICPHSNTAHFDGACADQHFLDGLIAILLRCDLIVLAPRWKTSIGTLAEIRAANRAGIPVVEWPDLEQTIAIDPDADLCGDEPAIAETKCMKKPSRRPTKGNETA